jgi:hypothetical protein
MNKILFSTSILLNSILVMFVVGVLPFFLFLAVLVIFGLIWYVKRLLAQMSSVKEDIESVAMMTDNFASHVHSISELETFYGDETLHSLLLDAQRMAEVMYDFSDKYAIQEGTDAEKEEE